MVVSFIVTAITVSPMTDQTQAVDTWPISYGQYNGSMRFILLEPEWNLITTHSDNWGYVTAYSVLNPDNVYFGPYGYDFEPEDGGFMAGYYTAVRTIELASPPCTGNPDPDSCNCGEHVAWCTNGVTYYGEDFTLEPCSSYWVYNAYAYTPGPNPPEPPGGWPAPNYVQIGLPYGHIHEHVDVELSYGWQSIAGYGVQSWNKNYNSGNLVHINDFILSDWCALLNEAGDDYFEGGWSINGWHATDQEYENYNKEGGTNFHMDENQGISIYVDGPATLRFDLTSHHFET